MESEQVFVVVVVGVPEHEAEGWAGSGPCRGARFRGAVGAAEGWDGVGQREVHVLLLLQ